MEERLFMVIYRVDAKGKWKPEPNGIYNSRRLVEMHIELQKANGSGMEYAFVEGPITCPAEMAAQEAVLGEF